ncbi:hypothetical protein LTR10_019893 [Elasticomyces elasticus]|uniref:Uncharacterized protein n=1 Tax=Exophiala sideris TaxID=1016849 RepID=A0ABR0IXI2_9EURO|nr:hypothetical protein LTR10_019893 [Elasticomyces elasticus]KAK5022383.1 hypothetical protein LTS07_010043 [Exophiala sideris]KAK5027259.1 hypothetical protein LTR13_009654 [Exophiala sideris]KAK5051237.1 hypothetical protein LTR69_010263 [Exophiala sideris]KAK5177799.1 hypothetical protein LTR44_009774 [Eurotiomycetes sp. CCFEE 6388]
MERRVRIWTIGTLAGAFTIASTTLNVVFASNTSNISVLAALRTLLFIAFAVSLVDVGSIICFSTIYVQRLCTYSLGGKKTAWGQFIGGLIAAVQPPEAGSTYCSHDLPCRLVRTMGGIGCFAGGLVLLVGDMDQKRFEISKGEPNGFGFWYQSLIHEPSQKTEYTAYQPNFRLRRCHPQFTTKDASASRRLIATAIVLNTSWPWIFEDQAGTAF